MLQSFVTGLLISAGLLVAIGAQNTFVIRQGIKKEFVFTVSVTCFLCDFILMCIGVLGVGEIVNQSQTFLQILTIVGVLFLLWYGIQSFKNAYKGESQFIDNNEKTEKTLLGMIVSTMAFSLLNPNVWIDTVAIVGGVSTTIESDKKYFILRDR